MQAGGKKRSRSLCSKQRLTKRPKPEVEDRRHQLFINDPGTHSVELKLITGVNHGRAMTIIAERNVHHFCNKYDLIRRIPGISLAALALNSSQITLRFETKQQAESKEAETIFNIIKDNAALRENATSSVRIIAEYAKGGVQLCDAPFCESDVCYSIRDLISGLLVIPGKEWKETLPHPHHYMYKHFVTGKEYYHRKSRSFGDQIYCADCSQSVVNCPECQRNTYIDHNPESFLVCPGAHGQSYSWCWATSWANLQQTEPFAYKVCTDCNSVCPDHQQWPEKVSERGSQHRWRTSMSLRKREFDAEFSS